MSAFERVLLGIPALDTVLDVSNSNCILYYDLESEHLLLVIKQ